MTNPQNIINVIYEWSQGGSKGGSKEQFKKRQMLRHFWFVKTWQNDEKIKVHQNFYQVQACVRRTLKYITARRLL